MLIHNSWIGTGRRCFIVYAEESDQNQPVTVHVWKKRHSQQGFIWHRGYVGFALSTGFETFNLEVYLLDDINKFVSKEDALRSFKLPFEVDSKRYVFVEFSDYFQLEPGNYALFCEMGFREEDIEYIVIIIKDESL